MAGCTVNTEAPCGLQYNSSRVQLQSLLLLLCAALHNLDAEFSCGNWDNILVATKNAGLDCLQVGPLKAKFAQQVCDGLDVDCSALDCFELSDLEAMKTYIGCKLVDELS